MKTKILVALLVMTFLALIVAYRGASWRVSGKTFAVTAAPQFPNGSCFSFSSDEVSCGNGPVDQGGCGLGSKTTAQFVTGTGRQMLQTNVVACAGAPNCPPETVDTPVDNPGCCDQDNDGYAGALCGGSDCDDNNFFINPGRAEVCNDGVNNNCFGGTDCGDWDCLNDPACCTGVGQSCLGGICCEGLICNESQVCEGCVPPCTGEYVCFNNLCGYTPIVIDVMGNGFSLTSGAGGVDFDFNDDGIKGRLSWTASHSDDAWLVLDRNHNGTIDNGRELFGSTAPQPSPPAGQSKNGFLALAVFDKIEYGGNGDGKIGPHDAIYPSLELWRDANQNGVSEDEELFGLAVLDVVEIDLDYRESKKSDKHGNQFRWRAKIYGSRGHGAGRWAWDVLLAKP